MIVGDKVRILSSFYEGFGGVRRGEDAFITRIAPVGNHPVWIKDVRGRECCFAPDELAVIEPAIKVLPDPRDYGIEAWKLRGLSNWLDLVGHSEYVGWMRATADVIDEKEVAA